MSGAPLSRAIAVVSGKGGVGKTNLVANVAVAASEAGARVLVVDGDLSLANVDVLLALVPALSARDLLTGAACADETILRGPAGVHVLPAASARPELAALDGRALEPLVQAIAAVEPSYDLVLVDAGAGVGPTVVHLASACARALLVATAEPTRLADAYAALKVLHARGKSEIRLVVNGAKNERQARATFDHLQRLAARFLGLRLEWLGWLPNDPRLAQSVTRQRAVVQAFPGAPVARRVRELARRLVPRPDAHRTPSPAPLEPSP